MSTRRELRARLAVTVRSPVEASGRPPVPAQVERFEPVEWIERAELPAGIGPAEAVRRMRDVPREQAGQDEWQCRAALHLARRRWRIARYQWAKANRYDLRELDPGQG